METMEFQAVCTIMYHQQMVITEFLGQRKMLDTTCVSNDFLTVKFVDFTDTDDSKRKTSKIYSCDLLTWTVGAGPFHLYIYTRAQHECVKTNTK